MTAIYFTEPGTVVRYQNESLHVKTPAKSQSFRLAEIALAVVQHGVQLTSVVITELLDRGIETIGAKLSTGKEICI